MLEQPTYSPYSGESKIHMELLSQIIERILGPQLVVHLRKSLATILCSFPFGAIGLIGLYVENVVTSGNGTVSDTALFVLRALTYGPLIFASILILTSIFVFVYRAMSALIK
jgi:hypothetical protein